MAKPARSRICRHRVFRLERHWSVNRSVGSKAQGRTTVNCFSHLAQVSKSPTGGFDSELPALRLFLPAPRDRAVYSSSSDSSEPPFFPSFFFSAAFNFCSCLFVSLRFFPGLGSSSGSLSRFSESYSSSSAVCVCVCLSYENRVLELATDPILG